MQGRGLWSQRRTLVIEVVEALQLPVRTQLECDPETVWLISSGAGGSRNWEGACGCSWSGGGGSGQGLMSTESGQERPRGKQMTTMMRKAEMAETWPALQCA